MGQHTNEDTATARCLDVCDVFIFCLPLSVSELCVMKLEAISCLGVFPPLVARSGLQGCCQWPRIDGNDH